MTRKLITKGIKIPNGVTVLLKNNNSILLSSINGSYKLDTNKNIQISIDLNYIYLINCFKNKNESKKYLNLYTSLLKTNLKGLSQKFKINLFLNGIGYKVQKIDNILYFKLGYSHEIKVNIPPYIDILILKPTQILFYGTDWNKLTQYVHNIKRLRKIEPYKGKGILLKNETILRKEGKKNKK